MSNIKNKDTLFLVMRYSHAEFGDEICCAITRTGDKADDLCGEYRQQMLDRGITHYDFYVTGQTYYDE